MSDDKKIADTEQPAGITFRTRDAGIKKPEGETDKVKEEGGDDHVVQTKKRFSRKD